MPAAADLAELQAQLAVLKVEVKDFMKIMAAAPLLQSVTASPVLPNFCSALLKRETRIAPSSSPGATTYFGAPGPTTRA